MVGAPHAPSTQSGDPRPAGLRALPKLSVNSQLGGNLGCDVWPLHVGSGSPLALSAELPR